MESGPGVDEFPGREDSRYPRRPCRRRPPPLALRWSGGRPPASSRCPSHLPATFRPGPPWPHLLAAARRDGRPYRWNTPPKCAAATADLPDNPILLSAARECPPAPTCCVASCRALALPRPHLP